MLAFGIAVICVVLNGCFVAAEFSLAKVRVSALQAEADKGDSSAQLALKLAGRLEPYLSATQLGITLASLALGWIGEPAIAEMLLPTFKKLHLSQEALHASALGVSFVVITILHIVVGEIVPKTIALRFPLPVSKLSARPLQLFFYLVYPLLPVLNGIAQLLLRLLGVAKAGDSHQGMSKDELRLLIQASLAESTDAAKIEFIEGVLRGMDRSVRTIMVPRVDMHTLSIQETYATALEKIRKTGFSRYPLTDGQDPDRIVGYMYVKDLLMLATRGEPRIADLRRDILYVPESRTVSDALNEFRKNKIPIAIVVDEYGGTGGMLTLEDCVEEIVGEIQDELDMETPRMQPHRDGTWLVDGTFLMDDLKLEGLVIPEDAQDETISAHMVRRLGRLAFPGDRVELGEYIAVVDDVRRRRVFRVVLKRTPKPTTAPPSGSSAS